ncbi:MAG: hypothetical protein JO360_05415 [Acidobacteria bacterium]|nr:hypothetical protein [Acidobacteriota bacterium]
MRIHLVSSMCNLGEPPHTLGRVPLKLKVETTRRAAISRVIQEVEENFKSGTIDKTAASLLRIFRAAAAFSIVAGLNALVVLFVDRVLAIGLGIAGQALTALQTRSLSLGTGVPTTLCARSHNAAAEEHREEHEEEQAGGLFFHWWNPFFDGWMMGCSKDTPNYSASRTRSWESIISLLTMPKPIKTLRLKLSKDRRLSCGRKVGLWIAPVLRFRLLKWRRTETSVRM